jgi:hypothetical protein
MEVIEIQIAACYDGAAAGTDNRDRKAVSTNRMLMIIQKF